MALLFCACSNEDLETSATPSVVSQLKNDLKLDQFEMQNFAKNVAVNWEAINTIEKDGLTIYEIPISEINQTTIASNLFQEQLKYGLIAVKKGDEMHSYLIEAYSSANHSLYANTIQNLGQFTGTLNVYELNGKSVGQLVVFNGKSTNPSSNNYLTPLDETINLFYVSKKTTSRLPSCNMTQFLTLTNRHEVRHYVPTVIVGTYTNWGYSYSTFTLTTTRTYMSVPYPCGTDADYHHVPYMVTTHEDVYDAFKITNELTGKAKCLNDLLDKNGDSFVKKLLANFRGESEFNIKIVSKDNVFSTETGLEVNGNTTSPLNNTIVIDISTSRTNINSNLDAVRTILHEYIHADIFRKLNTKYPVSGELNFKKTYETYGSQHGTMGALYITSMRDALKSFHKNVLTNDYNSYINYYGETPSDAFYEALAWGGLRDSNVKAWEDLSTLMKTEIENLVKRNAVLTRTAPCPN